MFPDQNLYRQKSQCGPAAPGVQSCDDHLQVGDSYMVYENEILHNRRLIPDGPNFISRDSNFK